MDGYGVGINQYVTGCVLFFRENTKPKTIFEKYRKYYAKSVKERSSTDEQY